MLNLITGTPGSGKTLWTIDQLKEVEDRPIYYHGIPELALDWYQLDDPAQWAEKVPDGAIVVIDEVQKTFGPRPPKDGVPNGVRELETHRHRGIDLYWVTQHPTLLDHHARRLVGRHVHIQRNKGMKMVTVYDGDQVMDTKDRRDLQKAEKKQWKYPKDVFSLYKSAEAHTHKARLPKKLLLLPALVLFIGLMAWWGASVLFDEEGQEKNRATAEGVRPESVEEPEGDKPLTAGDWRRRLEPKVPGLPYTAPIYRKAVKVKAVPKVAGCIASSGRCICYTQQGTRIDGMPDESCEKIAVHGRFDFQVTLEAGLSVQEGEPVGAWGD